MSKTKTPNNYTHPGKKYDEIADQYDDLFSDAESTIEENKVMATIQPMIVGVDSILDIGSGTGLLLDYFNIPPNNYYGVDPSVHMTQRLYEKHPNYQGRVYMDPYESINWGMKFDVAVSLFGSVSYIFPDCLDNIPRIADTYFLMFFKPDYTPVTHVETGVDINYYPNAAQTVDFGRKYVFNNYVIVTNCAGHIED